jgi:hypothetical protein
MNSKEAIQLESKKDMRRRGVPSPNVADALACTFAFAPFMYSNAENITLAPTVVQEPDPFDPERMYA